MASQAHNPKGFRPFNPNAPVFELPEAASQSFSAGDAVYLVSGLVTLGIAAGATCVGVAAADASGTTGALVPVWGVANPHELFVGRANGDASSLVAGNLIDLIGATTAMEFDEDASSTDIFVFHRFFDPSETTSTAGVRLVCSINPAIHDLHL